MEHTHRLFEGHPAVVYTAPSCVVLDRDKLPKRKADGSSYHLAHTRYRWILYTDVHPRYSGEWNVFSSKSAAIAEAQKSES